MANLSKQFGHPLARGIRAEAQHYTLSFQERQEATHAEHLLHHSSPLIKLLNRVLKGCFQNLFLCTTALLSIPVTVTPVFFHLMVVSREGGWVKGGVFEW
jgi:hypothetical protein